MKVLKVIVDGNFPPSCKDCELSCFYTAEMNYWCLVMDKMGEPVRPSWCPLEVETDAQPPEVKHE